ncbi:MAG: VRR-NUC domain-containing protein [Bacteroidia bacterium]
MKHLESKIQINCVKWFKIQFPMYVLFSIPNGGARRLIEAKILKAEGVMSGVSDLFLMFGNGTYNGLFIEMKTEIGKQNDNQKLFEKKCANFKFKYIICRSLNEFIIEITNYINNK